MAAHGEAGARVVAQVIKVGNARTEDIRQRAATKFNITRYGHN